MGGSILVHQVQVRVQERKSQKVKKKANRREVEERREREREEGRGKGNCARRKRESVKRKKENVMFGCFRCRKNRRPGGAVRLSPAWLPADWALGQWGCPHWCSWRVASGSSCYQSAGAFQEPRLRSGQLGQLSQPPAPWQPITTQPVGRRRAIHGQHTLYLAARVCRMLQGCVGVIVPTVSGLRRVLFYSG